MRRECWLVAELGKAHQEKRRFVFEGVTVSHQKKQPTVEIVIMHNELELFSSRQGAHQYENGPNSLCVMTTSDCGPARRAGLRASIFRFAPKGVRKSTVRKRDIEAKRPKHMKQLADAGLPWAATLRAYILHRPIKCDKSNWLSLRAGLASCERMYEYLGIEATNHLVLSGGRCATQYAVERDKCLIVMVFDTRVFENGSRIKICSPRGAQQRSKAIGVAGARGQGDRGSQRTKWSMLLMLNQYSLAYSSYRMMSCTSSTGDVHSPDLNRRRESQQLRRMREYQLKKNSGDLKSDKISRRVKKGRNDHVYMLQAWFSLHPSSAPDDSTEVDCGRPIEQELACTTYHLSDVTEAVADCHLSVAADLSNQMKELHATFYFSTNSTALQTAYSEADANRVDSTDLNLMCDHFAFPREGTAYVNARAILENPRIIPGPQDSFIFDIIICCSLPITGTQVVCSLCYLTRQDNEYIDVGLYDIYAKNTIGCFFPTGHTSEKPDTF
ncbi:hypothetical protein EDB85DRAFT_2189836 [Lactarius pseudohatsudake]|nr:hypothetical protein EDB85DRAFT_2189836 [Lactarius pseudohatsudake]